MKKGFFLLEALLASAVLMIMVGAVLQHYGQWARAYRNTKECNAALSCMHECIEKDGDRGNETYHISKRVHTIEQPIGLPPEIIHPRVQCTEIEITWNDGKRSMFVIAGITDEE